MINVFVRAVIFGVGVELGREVYKGLKTLAVRARAPEGAPRSAPGPSAQEARRGAEATPPSPEADEPTPRSRKTEEEDDEPEHDA